MENINACSASEAVKKLSDALGRFSKNHLSELSKFTGISEESIFWVVNEILNVSVIDFYDFYVENKRFPVYDEIKHLVMG